jgi:hypothetical protein
MLSNQLRIIIIICMILALIYIVGNIRRQLVNFRYGIGWMVVAILIMILAIWPSLLITLSRLLGIAAPVNMLFFLGFVLVVVVIFSLSKSVSDLSEKVKQLSQELAIAKKDTYDNYQRKEEKKEELKEND